MRSTAVPVLLALVACGEKPSGSPPQQDTDTGAVDTDTGTPAPPEEPPTWLVSGQVGQVFVVNKLRAGSAVKSEYTIQGMFADNLQGLATAAWCQGDGPCLASIPAAGQEADSAGLIDPLASVWAWNGHAMSVGTVEVPFIYDVVTGLAWYDFSVQTIPVDDVSPLAVSFDGEWGRFDGEVALDALTIQAPDPNNSVPLTEIVQFRWTPTGEDDVYLRVTSGAFDRLWHLEDDGEFDLDVTTLDLGAGGEEVSMSLQRWDLQTHDVNGNELTLVGVWEQPFSALVCEASDYPVVAIDAYADPEPPFIDPAAVSVAFMGVIDSEKPYDYEIDSNLDGAPEPWSARLVFTFLDDAGAPLCTIYYDASAAVHVGSPTPVSGSGVIFDAWEVNLANGSSGCDAVDPTIWGKKDLRDILQLEDWGFGIGTVDETEAALSAVYDWATYEPVMAGSYIKVNAEWYEVGGVTSSAMETCGVVDPDLVDLPKPTGSPLPIRYYESLPVVTFPMGE